GLEGGDGMDLGSAADGLGGGLGESQKTHLALGNQLAHGANGFFDGCLRVNAVLIVEVNNFHAQPFEAGVAAGANVFGPAIDANEAAGRVTDVAKFGGQHDLAAPAAHGLADKDFVRPGAVNVSRVEEVHTQVEGAVNGGDGLGFVARPIKFRHAHATQPQGGDGQAACSKMSSVHVKSFRFV